MGKKKIVAAVSGGIFAAMSEMRDVTLVFPDTHTLAEFILKYRISQADVRSADCTLRAELSEDELAIACMDYNAEIKRQPFFHWS